MSNNKRNNRSTIKYPRSNDKWYKKVYNKIIRRAKKRGLDKNSLEGYYEKHHIVPKCLGGDNKKDNLVLLTAKEHFIAHRILYRLHPDNYKLLMAVIAMLSPGNVNNHRETVSLSTAQYYRKLHADSLRGKHLSEQTRKKISDGNKGRKLSQEQVELLRRINTGKHPTEETRRRMSIAHSRENLSEEIIEKIRKSSTGRKHTEETKRKISIANSGKVRPQDWCDNISKAKKGKPGHAHSEETKKYMSENSPRRVKVLGPDSIVYSSIKECATALGIHRDTLVKWIKHKPEKGFSYYKE